MSERRDWETRYRDRHDGEQPPSRFLLAQLGRLPAGRVLDLACGAGRNALLLARRGFVVEAIDFSRTGLERLAQLAHREHLPVRLVQADLEHFPLPSARYGVIVNVRYLQRELIAAMKRAVRPGGVVLFETFIRDQQQFGHPRNPDFLLERGELAERFGDFTLLSYEEGLFDSEGGPAYLARALAQRPDVD
jgi:SAM-dependent methyltransferase